MTDDSKVAFDKQMLLEVVHYVISRCTASELGNVKLHKILYFSDMLHYLATGEPLTGVEYRKQKFGPVARHLTWACERLSESGKIKIDRRDYLGFQKMDYSSIRNPDSRSLSNQSVQILNDVIEFVCSRSAREISELSHNSAWEAAKIGETLPYFTVFGWLPAAISESELREAVNEARKIRPIIEAERRESAVF